MAAGSSSSAGGREGVGGEGWGMILQCTVHMVLHEHCTSLHSSTHQGEHRRCLLHRPPLVQERAKGEKGGEGRREGRGGEGRGGE